MSVSRPEGGTIESLGADGMPDGKIRCGTRSTENTSANACGPATYDWSDTVSFSATPDHRFKFIGWAADCQGSGPCSFSTATAGADKWIAAAFAPTAVYRGRYFLVTVEKPSGGTVASVDGRIYCGSAEPDANRCGPALYDWKGSAVLDTMPDAGHVFFGWGGDCSGKGDCTLTAGDAGSDKTVRAKFATGLSVRLAVAGLADVGLKVANLDGSIRGISANGSYSLGEAADGARYSVIVTSNPPTQVCSPEPAGGTIDGDDVLVQMTCACKDQLANCDRASLNGCEVNLGFDVANCGACGRACTVANGTPACNAGVCGIASCASGYTQHAGACIPVTRACVVDNGRGTESWNGSEYGTCNVTSCSAGYSLSNNACVPTVIACMVEHGSGTQTYGADGYGPCLVTACDGGFNDCDGSIANGCEAAYATDVENCGGCGVQCGAIEHGEVACVQGACVTASCDPGYVMDGAGCVPVEVACTVPHGAGVQTWDGDGYGDCVVTSCGDGYGLLNNACAPIEVACDLTNGSGTQTLLNGVYGPCILSACDAGFGDCDLAPDTGCEVALTTLRDCRACGNACSEVANGQASCKAGGCGVASCNTGFTLVNGQCIQSTIACDVQHGTGTRTWNGADYGACVVSSCSAGYHIAGGACEPDVKQCTVANGSGTQTWTGSAYGGCVVNACDAGFTNCDGGGANGCEVTLQTDVNNCGSCGHVCPTVQNGTRACTAGVCGASACGAGYTLHDGSCVATSQGCSVSNGTGVQSWNGSGYGACVAAGCDSGYHLSNGACAADVIGCSVANGTGTRTWDGSTYGQCVVVSCGATYANCDGSSSTGCEAALQGDVNNCGGCGRSCPAVANGTRACLAGVCGASACNPGYSLTADGRCVATTRSCSIANGTGEESWQGTGYGACTVTSCAQGFHVSASNTCAADVIACDVVNGEGTQTWNGTAYASCEIAACFSGFTDCDESIANGCESTLRTDPDDCGSCGNVCPAVANGTRACTSGVCGVAACDPGYSLWSGSCWANQMSCDVTNGSGMRTWTGEAYSDCAVTSCDAGYHAWGGACDPDQISCSVANGSGTRTWYVSDYGACVVNACSGTYRDCDSSGMNGCEAQIQSDPDNCGGCGQRCPAPANGTAACVNGTCALTCDADYHLNGTACELNVRACSDAVLHQEGTQTWSPTGWSACALTSCSADWLDCNAAAGHPGCEALATEKQNCGACNNNCGPLKNCVAGPSGYFCQ